jgi:hypothetical protein
MRLEWFRIGNNKEEIVTYKTLENVSAVAEAFFMPAVDRDI